MIIVWDEPKRLANFEKHGLDFADLSLDFFDSAVIRPAKRGRLQAIGRLKGGVFSCISAHRAYRSFRCGRPTLGKGRYSDES